MEKRNQFIAPPPGKEIIRGYDGKFNQMNPRTPNAANLNPLKFYLVPANTYERHPQIYPHCKLKTARR